MPIRLLLALLLPASVSAQLHVTARFGIADHSGHARDASDSDEPSFGPGVSRDGALAVGADRGAWRLAVVVRRETPDLVLVGNTSGIITRGALAAWHGGVEFGRRIVGHRGAAELHLLAGVGATRWTFPGFEDPARNRFAGWLALEGGLPFSARIDGVLRLEAMSGSSLFEEADLPEGYEALAARRIELALGLRWHR